MRDQGKYPAKEAKSEPGGLMGHEKKPGLDFEDDGDTWRGLVKRVI